MLEPSLGISREDGLAHYIGTIKTLPFYQKAFGQYDREGFVLLWSWWAFLFGAFFMLYRKLYLETFVALIPTLSLLLLKLSGGGAIIFGGWQISYLIVTALFAALLYNYLTKELKIYLVLNVLFSLWSIDSPFFLLLMLCLNATFAPYFVYQRYNKVLYMAHQYDVKGKEVLTALYDLGGVNKWAFVVGVLWIILQANYRL